MHQYEFIQVDIANQVARLILNRPDKRNAMHAPFIQEILTALTILSQDDTRVLIIQGNGDNFCAGGDIHWMQKIAEGPSKANYDDAQLLADMLQAIYTFPKPTIVLAHGAVMGGGLGLLAACDIAISADDAVFSFSEVKIGLTPSMISPYVIAAIGERAAHYYFLTGEKFDANESHRIGLVHRIVKRESLLSEADALAKTLIQNGPQALKVAKELMRSVAKEKITAEIAKKTASHLAALRETPEAQEGLKAFMEKRKARWS